MPKVDVPCSIDGYSFAVGYQTGLLNRALQPPAAVDRYSFYAGILEGKAKRQEDQTVKKTASTSPQKRKLV
jgi:hypothetical protein